MILLIRGDRLPIVATVQLLLNSRLRGRRPLRIDGDFGRRTAEAVIEFQHQNRVALVNGHVGPETWARLTEHTRLQIRDIVDVFDPLLTESQHLTEVVGSTPIIFGGGSNSVGWVVPAIAGSGVAPRSLVLLRFHGHGNRGVQVTGYGTGCHVLFDAIRHQPAAMPPLDQCAPQQVNPTPTEMAMVQQVMSHSAISLRSLALPDVVASLTPLGNFFSPTGSIEFHGCQVAGGTVGEQFLRRIVDLFGVPAVAAQEGQTTGNAIRFRGRIRMAFPHGDLRSWARSLAPIRRSF